MRRYHTRSVKLVVSGELKRISPLINTGKSATLGVELPAEEITSGPPSEIQVPILEDTWVPKPVNLSGAPLIIYFQR